MRAKRLDKGRVPVTRHFLGWDAPLAQKVCDFLLTDRDQRPVDLSALRVVVPTRQSGRRLREALARRCAERETGLLAPEVLAPGDLLATSRGSQPVAPPALVTMAWTRVLLQARLTDFAALFPALPPAQDLAWASHLAGVLERLCDDLCEGGLSLGTVVAEHADELQELDRWLALAQLEQAFRQSLERLGYRDPCAARIAAAAQPQPPAGLAALVVAGVADLPPLAAQALQNLSSALPVQILVHAPPGEQARFDAWGRPLVEAWSKQEIPIPDAGENLVLGGSPAGQSRAVLEILEREAGTYSLTETAIGVPDAEVTPFLSAALGARGLKTYDPGGRLLRDHPLFQLLDALRRLLSEGDYPAWAALLRHVDVLACLEQREDVAPIPLLTELDAFQNEFLPVDFEDVLARLRLGAVERRFPSLFKAARLAARLRERFRETTLPEALSGVLQEVYALRQVRPAEARDAEFLAVARVLNDAVEEFDARLLAALKLSARDGLELLIRRVRDERYYPDTGDASLDLEGWLELPWNEAPLLVVTGLNEGTVPDSRCADLFLPDSLRRQLGLRHEAERCARDAFLLRGLVEARRTRGRVVLLAGRTSAAGDPLRPSRLLFRCPDEALAERCAALFGEPREPRPQHPATVSFKLDPNVVEAEPIAVMYVTRFRDYLACPFRFYLKHALGMEAMDDRKSELDQLDFGTLVHAALQGLNDAAWRGVRDEPAVAGHLVEAVDEWVRARFGANPPLQILIQREAARQRLRAAARGHVQGVGEGWEIVDVERSFSARLGGLEIRGKVDRIERHRDTGALRLLDYKTSDRGVDPAKAHLAQARADTPDYARVRQGGKERRWIDLQLPLYRMLLSEHEEFRRAPDVQVGYFNLPKAVTETGLALWDSFDENLMESARRCAEGVTAGVIARRFWPPQERVPFDEFAVLFPRPAPRCLEPLR